MLSKCMVILTFAVAQYFRCKSFQGKFVIIFRVDIILHRVYCIQYVLSGLKRVIHCTFEFITAMDHEL